MSYTQTTTRIKHHERCPGSLPHFMYYTYHVRIKHEKKARRGVNQLCYYVQAPAYSCFNCGNTCLSEITRYVGSRLLERAYPIGTPFDVIRKDILREEVV